MTLEQLQRFMVVAETLNFTAAAQRMFIGQATVSRQMAMLEEEFGTALFIRHSKSVELTPAGEALMESIPILFSDIRHMRETVLTAANSTFDTLRITTRPGQYPIVNEICADILQQHPYLKIKMIPSHFLNICRDLDHEDANVAITYSFLLPTSTVYEYVPLQDEYFVMLCRQEHQLAKRAGIYLAQIDPDSILFGMSGVNMVLHHEAFVGEPQTKITENVDEEYLDNALMQIQLTDQVLILPVSAAAACPSTLAQVRLLDPELDHELLAIYKKQSASPSLALFLEAARRRTCDQ